MAGEAVSSAKTINGFAFARAGERLEVRFAVAEFDRLSDVIVQHADAGKTAITARLVGVKDKDSRCYIDLIVNAALELQCQRCLKSLSFDIDIDKRLELVRSEADIVDDDVEDEWRDVLVASREMSVKSLVEDEILLALPMVARHEDCGLPGS